MSRTGLRRVVKTVRGGTRRTYYVKSNPQPLSKLKAYKAKGGTSAAARGAKIGALAGAVVGGAMGTIGGSILGGAVRHGNYTSHVRAVSPWAGVGGNDPRMAIAWHRPGMVGRHYAGGVALGGAAGGAVGVAGGAMAGAAFGGAVGKLAGAVAARRRRNTQR